MVATHGVSDSQRRQMIAEAAYFIAEHRGFNGGDPVADWLQAEAEVTAMLREPGGFLDQLEKRLADMNRRSKAARRKLAKLKGDAREEWERDIEKLAKLRDVLQDRFTALRRRGEDVSERAREQLERTWDDAAELLHSLERRIDKART